FRIFAQRDSELPDFTVPSDEHVKLITNSSRLHQPVQFAAIGIQPLTVYGNNFVSHIDATIPGAAATGYAGNQDTAVVCRRVETDIRQVQSFVVVDQLVACRVEVTIVVQWTYCMCGIEDVRYRSTGNLLNQRLEFPGFKATFFIDIEFLISRSQHIVQPLFTLCGGEDFQV